MIKSHVLYRLSYRGDRKKRVIRFTALIYYHKVRLLSRGFRKKLVFVEKWAVVFGKASGKQLAAVSRKRRAIWIRGFRYP